MEEAYYYGMDLSWDITQISRFNRRTGEPESVCISGSQQELLMPAVLCRKKAGGEWLTGQDAIRMAARGNADLVSGLLKRMKTGEAAVLEECSFTPEELMEKYLRGILAFFRQCYGTSEITRLAVTVPDELLEMKEVFLKLFAGLGVEQEKLLFLSHSECLMYYCVNTPTELWLNDIALFECDEENFTYIQLSSSRKKQPIAILSDSRDFTKEYVEYAVRTQSPERKAYWFYELAMQQLQGRPVSTIYVTGTGFAGGWADDALRRLCDGRRVFFGQNLYTKGACQAARMVSDGSAKEFLFLNGDMIRESIYLKLYHDSTEEYVELARAGMNYRNVFYQSRIIPDDTGEIEFLVANALKKEPLYEVMILEHPVKRKNKTIKLELTLYYADRETPVVQIRDLGFCGEESTCRIWEQLL